AKLVLRVFLQDFFEADPGRVERFEVQLDESGSPQSGQIGRLLFERPRIGRAGLLELPGLPQRFAELDVLVRVADLRGGGSQLPNLGSAAQSAEPAWR